MKAKTNKDIFEHSGRKWTRSSKKLFYIYDFQPHTQSFDEKCHQWEIIMSKSKGCSNCQKGGRKIMYFICNRSCLGKACGKKILFKALYPLWAERVVHTISEFYSPKRMPSFLILHYENIKRANFQVPFESHRCSWLACLKVLVLQKKRKIFLGIALSMLLGTPQISCLPEDCLILLTAADIVDRVQ